MSLNCRICQRTTVPPPHQPQQETDRAPLAYHSAPSRVGSFSAIHLSSPVEPSSCSCFRRALCSSHNFPPSARHRGWRALPGPHSPTPGDDLLHKEYPRPYCCINRLLSHRCVARIEIRHRKGTIRWLKEGFRGDRQPITSILGTDLQGFSKVLPCLGRA